MATVLGIYSNILENKNKKYSSLHHHLKTEKQIFNLSQKKMRIVSSFFVFFLFGCFVLFFFSICSLVYSQYKQSPLVQISESQDAQSRTRSAVPSSPRHSCSAQRKTQPQMKIKPQTPTLSACGIAEQQQHWSSGRAFPRTKNIPHIPP